MSYLPVNFLTILKEEGLSWQLRHCILPAIRIAKQAATMAVILAVICCRFVTAAEL